ncbi:hypothetical protein [Leucobacter komagatae]|uniref:Uncharacterized protein n=1 Tax=Leucobacter komagatae TaxID=55969 RepID=A0A0D0IL30_9MICO|nr:hypothetical protein [Leucobacter komagatae]KIP51822.1 hypothetical protein SD72_12820 [Leucobacter komagatae]
MRSSEVAESPQRAERFREGLSLALMLAPFVSVLVFLVLNPRAWLTDFAVFFSPDGELIRSDAGWVLAALALLASTVCGAIGLLGTRESWKYNRRWQRGFLGSVAAVLVSVLFGAWSMTQEIERGAAPSVGLAMFFTMCCMLYGVLCATISPRDSVTVWYADEEAHEDSEVSRF